MSKKKRSFHKKSQSHDFLVGRLFVTKRGSGFVTAHDQEYFISAKNCNGAMHGDTIESMLTGFHHYFFSLEHIPERTRKHIASPAKGSACKRLNMFLRWMVRKDQHGVDFGIWKTISPSNLICPLDLHVARVARILGLLKPAGNKEQNPGWETAIALTDYLRTLDSEDPVKYDFALFGLGAMNKKVITLY